MSAISTDNVPGLSAAAMFAHVRHVAVVIVSLFTQLVPVTAVVPDLAPNQPLRSVFQMLPLRESTQSVEYL